MRWQLAVAQGERIPLAQEAIPRRGAAIECRVYAEDSVKFLPSPGTITSLRVPAGPGIRDDSGVTEGSVISVHYDPMISKLCALADTRAAAIERMRRALAEYHVGGIRTNLAFHRQVMRHPAFVAGEYDTGFIERHKAELAPAAARRGDGDAGGDRGGGARRARRRRQGDRARSVADATLRLEAPERGVTAAPAAAARPSRTALLVAYATLYLVWGSTYFAIRIAVESWTPFSLAATRFAIAGVGLFAVLRARGAPAPSLARLGGGDGRGRPHARRRQRHRLLGGAVGPVGGGRPHPVHRTALDGAAPLVGPARPGAAPVVVGGIVVGLAGVAVLIAGRGAGPAGGHGGHALLLGRLALLGASLSWCVGGLLSPALPLPRSIALASAMEMVAASPILFVAAVLHGDWTRFHFSAVTPAGWAALVYLIVFGSLAGFGSYLFLLAHEGPARSSTNAFVNPLIAVALGAAFGGEPIGARTFLAAGLIVAAVAGVIWGTAKR